MMIPGSVDFSRVLFGELDAWQERSLRILAHLTKQQAGPQEKHMDRLVSEREIAEERRNAFVQGALFGGGTIVCGSKYEAAREAHRRFPDPVEYNVQRAQTRDGRHISYRRLPTRVEYAYEGEEWQSLNDTLYYAQLSTSQFLAIANVMEKPTL